MRTSLITLMICGSFVCIFCTGCAEESDNSADSTEKRTSYSYPTEVASKSDSVAESVDPAGEMQEDPVETVDQVLADIAQAEVTERTEDLRDAFGHLTKIAEKAVEVGDAMLSHRYEVEQSAAQTADKM